MIRKKYISTNILKMLAIFFVILMHNLQYNKNVDYQELYRTLGFDFWVAQAVSIFVIVTGFHYAMSIESLEKEILWYRKNIFGKKILRILPAFSVVFVFWILYMVSTGQSKIGVENIFVYLQGGAGPGGYYTVVILQFLILFPVLYYIVKRKPLFGSLIILGINVLYEYMVFQGVVRSSFHRLCCVRLMMGLLFGIIIYHFADELRKMVIVQLLFAGGYFFTIS